ncbi:max-like protein X isoform X4 [Equus asinus]|uniref:max-like protein X isoform X4 n=1 Tax=Equus asinus TaxID=9793 RepID=UPI0038F5DF21
MCFVSRRQGPTGRTSLKPPMLAQRQARPALRRRGPRAAHAPHPRPALRLSAVGWWAGVTWARLASSSRLRAGPRAGFRFGGSEMTEPGASPEDPWVKASPVGAHAGEGRAGGARARRGAGGRGNSLQSLKSPLLSRPRGCREDSSHPACAKVEYAYSDNSLDPDDEDSDYHQESYKESYKDRRRRAHTQAEQKRRDAIKRGYDDLQTIVPTCQQQDFSIGSQKLSKAIVLQKTIDYIQFLHKEKKKQEEEVSILRKEVTALKIMKVNYEQIVKAHQDNPHEGEDQVSDQVKFNVFQGIMDSLFQSFNASISVASFQELSACVFSWIEEHCKPQPRFSS